VNGGWAGQAERGNRFALRLILWTALRLGRTASRLVLYPITLYFLIKARPQRVASRRFLTRVQGHPAGLFQVARHIHCFAATILDRVFLLTGRQEALEIRVHNPQLISERVAVGQGFLLLGSHLGSFEVLRVLAVEQQQLPLKILMDPMHNQIITKVLDGLNPAVAATVLPLGTPRTLLAVKEALDAGSMVGLLGDRCGPDETGITCRFFERPARFPTGPMVLAALTQVPVVLAFGLYRGGNHYDLHFEDLAERVELDRRDREGAVCGWVQRYAERLEYHTRLAPYNWFNFYDFWNDEDSIQGPR
jgi:predicted LPLAT superfamily acyltransferase